MASSVTALDFLEYGTVYNDGMVACRLRRTNLSIFSIKNKALQRNHLIQRLSDYHFHKHRKKRPSNSAYCTQDHLTRHYPKLRKHAVQVDPRRLPPRRARRRVTARRARGPYSQPALHGWTV